MQFSRTTIWAAALVALVILALGALFWQPQSSPGAAAAQKADAMTAEKLELVTAAGVRALTVEVARTPAQQAKGLMFRTALPDDHGMLFPHETPREISMWMRNTYIPLDMVFIKPDGTIHRIEARTEPLSEAIISSQGDVAAVLELAGGAAERMGLKPGDRVNHALFRKQ